MAGIADDGGVRRHVVDDHRVGADLRVGTDLDRAEQLRAGADHHLVADGRVALAAREARAAERDALVHRHVVADLGRLPDHDAGAMVDEQAAPDLRGGVDLDPGPTRAMFASTRGTQRHAGLVQRVEIRCDSIAWTPP